jgi:Ca-activated chloride channel family protein
MKRVWFALVALACCAIACSKGSPSVPLLPPWQVLVTGVQPGSFASAPALVVCEGNGTGCAAVKPGLKLSGNKLVRTERGVSELELDGATHVELAEGSELLLEDGQVRSLELRSGGIVLTRQGAGADGPLRVNLVGRTLELVGPSSIVAQLDDINRGQLFVARGQVSCVEPPGTLPPVRTYHPGDGALLVRQGPADLHAVFAGTLSRFRQSVLAIAAPPPPPPEKVTEPRGLGTMTARVPGTTPVVEGVRLAEHRVRAVVRNGVAHTAVEEVFQNDTDRVLEGRYVFPLPADASITGLTLFVNGKPVAGELVEKQRAAAIFKGIVDDSVRPRDPALLEWVSGSRFSLKIFPIPARGQRKVILEYQQVLSADGPRQAYVYPLSFGAERRTPIDQLSIDVEISDGDAPVRGVLVSGYAASAQVVGSATRVSLRAEKSAPDHDFAVSFRRATPGATIATSERGFVALRLRAELPAATPLPPFQRRDRVLVLDTSQSQSHEALAAAGELALAMLRGLEPDERFAVLACDSACETLPAQGLLPANEKALSDAQAFIKARKPAGSSDLAGALLAAAERVPSGAAVQLVYVGDGAPSAGELTVSSIAGRVRGSFQQRKVDLRLFGAGVSVDETTLTGLARELSGSYDAVGSAGALSEQAEVLVAGLRSPLLVSPVVEAPPGVTELEPRGLPNLRLGEELVVVGKGRTPQSVTLRGTLDGAPYVLTSSIAPQPETDSDAPFVQRLWAESRIRELQVSGLPGAAAEVIDLSKRFRVMSRETSWLVLENEQMFAEFGIPRSRAASDDSAPTAEQRAAVARELDAIEPGGATAPSEPASSPAADAAGPTRGAPGAPVPAAPAPPAAKPAPAPAPSPPPAPAKESESKAKSEGTSGGLGGLGSSGRGADGAGSGAVSQSVAAPRSNVTVGAITPAGGTTSNAARVVAGMRAGFRACHQRALNEDPEAAGSIRLLLRVGSAGSVEAASAAPAGRFPRSLVDCVTARARAAQFEPPTGGPAILQVPVTFAILPGDGGTVQVLPSRPPPRRPPPDVAVSRPGDDGWLAQGQPALDKLSADLQANPSSRKRHEALVRGLLQRGRFVAALSAAERFVELDPDLPAARELLAYAAVATGDRKRAVAAVDALTEAAPNDVKAQGRAARAFEALGDETRACAHWRSAFELTPTSDSALFEALRCRSRVMGDRAAALRDARAVSKPGPLLQRLLPLLDGGEIPAFERSSGAVGQFEVSLSCEPKSDCPYVVVVTPTGTVFSPWTPALGRSSPTSFAFSGLMTGPYRILVVGGAPAAGGRVDVRALNARNVFNFAPGHAQTIATTQVTMAPAGAGLLSIGGITRF